MKWAFKEISNGKYSTEQIFKRAVELGLNCSENNFLRLIHNPLHCGHIIIPQFKDEEAYTVKGLHEPLIPDSLFYEVQDVLEVKKGLKRQKSWQTISFR